MLRAYGISATKQMVEGSKTDYTMHHSSYLYFIDRRGMLRALMPFGRPAAEIANEAGVRLLIYTHFVPALIQRSLLRWP